MNDQRELAQALDAIRKTEDKSSLQKLRTEYLGRHGKITQQLRSIGSLAPQERASAGQKLNQFRQEIERAIDTASKRLSGASEDLKPIDVTAPADTSGWGHQHPVTAVIDDIVRIFWQMGYQVVDGPEIENEWYNFEALRVPQDHPARDLQDTLYLEGGNLPRTHTSPVQIRHMESHQPPIRIIVPGKVYRNEDEDARHAWMFTQVEGLVVDEGISMAHLKGTLLTLMQGLLGPETKVKLLPSFFPYTEPSVELHATCPSCKGEGCQVCSETGWLEMGGAGMVHPQVLRNGGVDPEKYSGFAFGLGAERIAMVKHDVSDVRLFWRPDLRFLEQF